MDSFLIDELLQAATPHLGSHHPTGWKIPVSGQQPGGSVSQKKWPWDFLSPNTFSLI
jgi:hypothetical protein